MRQGSPVGNLTVCLGSGCTSHVYHSSSVHKNIEGLSEEELLGCHSFVTVFVCHHICYGILSGGGKKLVVSTRLIWRFFRSHNLLRQINLREEARSRGEGRMMLGGVASQRDVGGGGVL